MNIGRCDTDYYNLFERYSQITPTINLERSLPSVNRKVPVSVNSSGYSFPDIKYVKIFVQSPGRGADLNYLGKVDAVESDDGVGNTIISASDGDKRLNIITTDTNAQVKLVDTQGYIENDFVTNIKPRWDNKTKELTIIHVEEL